MRLADLGLLGPLSLLCLLPLLPLLPGCWPLSITEFQVPEFVEYGHVAQLKCKYDLSENESDRSLFVKWWWSPLNSSNEDRSQLYQRIAGYEAEAIPDNVEIDVDDGIKLLNVTAKDSGIYECEVSNIDEVRRRQKLIVYSQGIGPLLNVLLSEDETEVEVTCEALDVAPYPDISITLNGVTVESTGYVSDPVDGLYDIVENATVTLMEADGKTFSCEILFMEGNFTPPAFVASQIFYAPTVSTTEAAEDAATAIEDSSETSQPDVSGSIMFGGSWAMMATAALWLCCTANHQFFNLPILNI